MSALQQSLWLWRLKLFAHQARHAGATHDQIAVAVGAGIVVADRERLSVSVVKGGRS